MKATISKISEDNKIYASPHFNIFLVFCVATSYSSFPLYSFGTARFIIFDHVNFITFNISKIRGQY